jgi:hypothetical protein
MIATMPAIAGGPTDVPPTAASVSLAFRKPLVQVGENCGLAKALKFSEQIKYASCSGEALKEMSGTSRAPSFGTPAPVCQAGFGIVELAPPPPADNPTDVPPTTLLVSFQAPSGM